MRKWTFAMIAVAMGLFIGVTTVAQQHERQGKGPIDQPQGIGDFLQAGPVLINPRQVTFIRTEGEGDDLSVSVTFSGVAEPLKLSGDAARRVASQVRPLVDLPPSAKPGDSPR